MSLLSPQLQAFVAIVKAGTVHAAATDLGLTQTGVTQRIRALERELGHSLFTRSRKGMRLTVEGEALKRYCDGASELEGRVQSHSYDLTIAGPTSVMSSRIVDACRDLYFQFPKLNLHLLLDDTADRIQMLRSGRVQMAIVPPEEVANEMDSKRLKPDKYVLVASPEWKGRRLNEILEIERIIDFYEADFTTRNYLKKFSLLSQVKCERLFANDNATIIKMFSRGVGFGTLTQEIAKPHLDAGHLILLNGGAVLEDSLALAWYPRSQPPAYFKAILDSIK